MRTKLDYYLKRLAERYTVKCLSIPSILPNGVKIAKSTDVNCMWKYVLHCDQDSVMQCLVRRMKMERLAYTLETHYKKAWWVGLINPEGKSFTYSTMSGGLGLATAGGVVWMLLGALSNPSVISGAKLLVSTFSH